MGTIFYEFQDGRTTSSAEISTVNNTKQAFELWNSFYDKKFLRNFYFRNFNEYTQFFFACNTEVLDFSSQYSNYFEVLKILLESLAFALL